jgi:hypothetical protein
VSTQVVASRVVLNSIKLVMLAPHGEKTGVIKMYEI